MAQPGTVLITGCSDGGSGSALATLFQQNGYRVFATARDIKKMSKLESLHNVRLLTLDVVNREQIQAAMEIVSKETGGTLTYLINNAAQNHYMPMLDEDIETAKQIFDVNVWGPLAVAQAFAPLVIKAKGTMVFVSSVAGCLNVPYQGTYAASKRSEEIMAETLRMELAPFHVKVVSVVAGAVRTMIQTHFDDLKLPDGSIYAPIESTIIDRARGIDGAKRSDPMDYAKRVTADLFRGSTGRIWHGWSAGMVKFSTSFLPSSLLDMGVVKGTGLDTLAKSYK